MIENKSRIEVAKKLIRECIKISDLFKEYHRFNDPVWRGDGEYMITCPFHEDTSPSLSINDKTHQWNCFGCAAKGDAVTALMWLAKTVDRQYYSYAQAIDQLIIRNISLRERLPFDSVLEQRILVEDVLNRPRVRYSGDKVIAAQSMTDVYNFMKSVGRTEFMDIAYATSMMMNNQTPEQILEFFNAGKTNGPIVLPQKSEITAADLLAAMDDWGE